MIPSAARLFFEAPWWRNLFDNTLTVQFEHRMTAYALLALSLLHAIDAIRSRAGTAVSNGAVWLAAAMTLQATLGIFTLLHQVPIDLALAHQAVAIAVLTLAVLQAERLAPQPVSQKLGLCRQPIRLSRHPAVGRCWHAASVGTPSQSRYAPCGPGGTASCRRKSQNAIMRGSLSRAVGYSR